MRAPALILLFVALLVAALAIRDAQLRRRIDAAATANHALAQSMEILTTQLVEAQGKIESAQQSAVSLPVSGMTPLMNSAVSNRIATLENRVQSLTAQLTQKNPTPAVAEYDPTQPPVEVAVDTNAPIKRNWGEEQILGPPDTFSTADSVTSWASREANAGPEWLSAGFDKAVDIAEVRIRETHNPGAIAKVTAMVNGLEITLWEGTASGSKTVRDFVVRPPFNVTANSVVVHLDTTRVSGWNEIDAVELVGRDGSRQWASSANASSTYAPNRTTTESSERIPFDVVK